MAKITQQKKEAVESLKKAFSTPDGFIFTNFSGLEVKELDEMRKDLKKCDSGLKVVKNDYARVAFGDKFDLIKDSDMLKGPTAVAFVNGDRANEVAKVLYKVATDGQKLKVKGGLIGGEFMDASTLQAISKLPSKLELISSLLGTMKAPVQKLAATLLAIKEKMESGNAGAKDSQAPAAEPSN